MIGRVEKPRAGPIAPRAKRPSTLLVGPSGTERVASSHGIPGLDLRSLESYVEKLAELERDAASDEMPTLAYLVSIAKLEAEAQVARAQAAKQEREAGPDDLWQPG